MRKLGYFAFIAGIVYVILTLAIAFASTDSGSHLSAGYGIFMIIGGWQLIKNWKGIGRESKKTGSNRQDDISLAAQTEPSSRNMPVTSEISGLIQKRMQRLRKVRLIATLTAGLFGAAFVVGTSLLAGAFDAPIIVPWAAGAGLVFGGIIGGAMFFGGDMPLRRDSREFTYLRSTGQIKVVKSKFGYILRLADRALFVDHRQAKPFRNLDWATIDYSRHAKLIFAVRDRSGNLIYALAGTQA